MVSQSGTAPTMPKPLADLTPKARRTRSALLRAGRTVIGRTGPGGASVMAVCAEAAVGRGSFYTYFEDAQALTRTIAAETAVQIRERFDAAHAGMPRGLTRLRSCLAMSLRVAVEDPDTLLLLTSLAEDIPAIPARLRAEIANELAGAAATGALDASAHQNGDLARFLATAIMALAREIATGNLQGDRIDANVAIMMRACAAA